MGQSIKDQLFGKIRFNFFIVNEWSEAAAKGILKFGQVQMLMMQPWYSIQSQWFPSWPVKAQVRRNSQKPASGGENWATREEVDAFIDFD
jgi:hypothetical protein